MLALEEEQGSAPPAAIERALFGLRLSRSHRRDYSLVLGSSSPVETSQSAFAECAQCTSVRSSLFPRWSEGVSVSDQDRRARLAPEIEPDCGQDPRLRSSPVPGADPRVLRQPLASIHRFECGAGVAGG